MIRFNENLAIQKAALPKTVVKIGIKVDTPSELSNSKLMASYSRLSAAPALGTVSGA
jgi:hypothetical protein